MNKNYVLLLCFLIAFANSKLPKFRFKSFLESIKSDYDDDDDHDDDDLDDICESGRESSSACQSIPLKYKNLQCCYITEMDGNEYDRDCEPLPNPSKDIQNIVENKQFKALYEEILRFKYVNGFRTDLDDLLDFDIDIDDIDAKIDCKDKSFTISLNSNPTQEEIPILRAENHCLNYAISLLKGKNYDCKNGQVLQSSKDADIECGYLSITYKKTTKNTCMLVSNDLFKKIESLPLSFFFKTSAQFSIELSDSKGRKFKYAYDPKTQKMTLNSTILNISKYLLLLSLFLL